jgi:hypothetical protein
MKKLLGPFVAVRIGAHRVLLRADAAEPRSNEARRQTAAVAHPFRHNGELQAFAKAYVKFHEIRAEYEPS